MLFTAYQQQLEVLNGTLGPSTYLLLKFPVHYYHLTFELFFRARMTL